MKIGIANLKVSEGVPLKIIKQEAVKFSQVL